MSNKPKLFDNEMDEKTVERISNNFPVLTDEEKDRIFSFIEKEFDEDSETVEHEVFDDEVSGVERCFRPRWLEMLGTAAMIAIVVGSLGGGSYFMNHINKNAPKKSSQESTTNMTTTVTDEYSVITDTKPSVTTYTKTTVKPTTTSAIVVTVPVDINEYESALAAANVTTAYDIESQKDVITSITEIEPSTADTMNEPETIVTTTVTLEDSVQGQDIVTDMTNVTQVSKELSEEEKLASIAEALIDKYDTVTLMRVARLPFDESSETLTFIHGPGAYSSRAYEMQYKKVDKTVFKNMQEMKDFYDSVMYRTLQEDVRLFGPEISREEYEEGYLFYGDDPDYFFLSIDGELYEGIIGDMSINVHSDIPVVLSNLSEYRFQAKKVYHKRDDVTATSEVTFSFVKDFNTGIWRIINVSYNG